jgi:hypothetical protein
VPALSDEPALSFWLEYAVRRGALVEGQGDHTLVLLPDQLQRESGLPEEAAVTASPDVAREDGAVLLIAGHPAVELAAASVLTEGDTGCAYLPWPASRPPTRSMLEARAREHAPIEHGRIDAAGEPIAAYLPLLRVGAMVSYAASLTLRFQEQEEAWVDARTGAVPSDRLLATLRDRPRLPRPDGTRRMLQPDVPTAIPAVHAQLERRASARQASLALHATRALEVELTRAHDYYEAALESIARRRAAAPADRARMLETQADATRAESARRRREIEDEYRPRREVRPFRLHLVYLPAYVLEVDVRRGRSAFRCELAWVPAAGEFAAVRCPACGATEPLVATRERLGCRDCIAPNSDVARAVADSAPTSAFARGVADPARTSGFARAAPAPTLEGVEPPQPPRATAPLRTQTHAVDAPASLPDLPPPQPAAAGKPSTPTRQRHPAAARGGLRRQRSRNAERTGDKLAYEFWRCAASGDRWPRQKAARDSPLRAVYRIYGNEGPLRAIGLAPGEYPESMSSSTRAAGPGAGMLTAGGVMSRGRRCAYAISWWIAAGKPVIGEVMPAPHPLALPPLDGETTEIALRLLDQAPAPTVELDPVASQLWSAELERFGLPFALRCLATWWRIQPRIDPGVGHAQLAATVASAVASAAGITRTVRAETAAVYGADPTVVATTGRRLGPELQLDPHRGW